MSWLSFGLSLFPMKKWVRQKVGWCTPKAHPDIPEICVWTWDYRGDTSEPWSLDIPHEILRFCLQPHITEWYSQCWQGECSIVPPPALTANLYWSRKEFELLGQCERIFSCGSGVVISEPTQLVPYTYAPFYMHPACCIHAGCNSMLVEMLQEQ